MCIRLLCPLQHMLVLCNRMLAMLAYIQLPRWLNPVASARRSGVVIISKQDMCKSTMHGVYCVHKLVVCFRMRTNPGICLTDEVVDVLAASARQTQAS